jgi:hypothetical protein
VGSENDWVGWKMGAKDLALRQVSQVLSAIGGDAAQHSRKAFVPDKTACYFKSQWSCQVSSTPVFSTIHEHSSDGLRDISAAPVARAIHLLSRPNS